MEVHDCAAAAPQPHARSRSPSPPPHLRDLDYTARFTDLLNRLRGCAHTFPSSADGSSHFTTLFSFIQPDSSTSSDSLPARQLAYIEALAALSPHDASGWEEMAGQGVVWTKETLEQLVGVLEKVGTGTTADLGEGGSDGESARKDVLSARVVDWLAGIAAYVGGQVEERKDVKGKGRAVGGHSSTYTQSHPQNGPLPQQQASPDFPFGRLDADEVPRMNGIASTSASGFQHDSTQTLVAGNGPSSLDRKPFVPSSFRQDPSRPNQAHGADGDGPPYLDPKDLANLLTSSGRRVLIYQRVERSSNPPEWYMLGESGERRVKEEDGEDGIGWLGEKDGVDADGDARMATQVEGAQGRRRSERASSPPSERKAQVENERADDVDQVLEEPSPAQKPRDGVEGGGAHPNGVAGVQDDAEENGGPAKNAHLASPASQHQRSPSASSAARSLSRSPTPPHAQQQQPKQKKVQRQKPLVKKAQAGLFKPPSEVDGEDAENVMSSQERERKGKAVAPASKKREREEQEDVDELDSEVDGEVEASGEEQDQDSGASAAAKGGKRKKVGAAPAKKRPMPTVKKAGAAHRSSPRRAASSSKAAPSTSKPAKKRASPSYTSSEEDEVDQLASDEEPDKRPPPKKRTRASTERTSTQRARKTSSGTSASPASSPKAGKKAAPAKKAVAAPPKSQKPVKEGSRRRARMSSEAPGVKKEDEVFVEAGTIGFAIQRTAGLRCWPVWILRSDEDSVVFCPLPGTRPIADAEPVICTNSLRLVSSPPIAPVPDGTPILDAARVKALRLAQELAADKRELKKWVARVEKVWAEQEVEESE